jgi:hypothetical protein
MQLRVDHLLREEWGVQQVRRGEVRGAGPVDMHNMLPPTGREVSWSERFHHERLPQLVREITDITTHEGARHPHTDAKRRPVLNELALRREQGIDRCQPGNRRIAQDATQKREP